jgi:hypothetical protein
VAGRLRGGDFVRGPRPGGLVDEEFSARAGGRSRRSRRQPSNDGGSTTRQRVQRGSHQDVLFGSSRSPRASSWCDVRGGHVNAATRRGQPRLRFSCRVVSDDPQRGKLSRRHASLLPDDGHGCGRWSRLRRPRCHGLRPSGDCEPGDGAAVLVRRPGRARPTHRHQRPGASHDDRRRRQRCAAFWRRTTGRARDVRSSPASADERDDRRHSDAKLETRCARSIRTSRCRTCEPWKT